MSLIHILNNYHNPFPHLKGRGGLHFHPSRRIIGGMLGRGDRDIVPISKGSLSLPVETIELKEEEEEISTPEPYEDTTITQGDEDIEFKKNGELYAITKYNATKLQKACKIRGLSTEGTRQELWDRLDNFIKKPIVKSDEKSKGKSKKEIDTEKKAKEKEIELKKEYKLQDIGYSVNLQKKITALEIIYTEMKKHKELTSVDKPIEMLNRDEKYLNEIESLNKSAIKGNHYVKTIPLINEYRKLIEKVRAKIEKSRVKEIEYTPEEIIELYKKEDETKYDEFKKELFDKVIEIHKLVEIGTKPTSEDVRLLYDVKKLLESNALTPERYPKTTQLINLINDIVKSSLDIIKTNAIKAKEDAKEEREKLIALKAEEDAKELALSIERTNKKERNEKASKHYEDMLMKKGFSTLLTNVKNPKIVKKIDDVLDQLIEGLITKSARDTVDRMEQLFTDISTVKGHGKSFENILCNTDFKYVLQSISGSTSPILNNENNPKLKGHMAKYKIQGQSLPLGSVCVYDLHDGVASYECKNYFGTKIWPEGESYYGNTTGLSMQIDKFEGNHNFTPYFSKVNGKWKLYNLLVEYSHDLDEEGNPKKKWLYKNYNTDLIFVILCHDALVYYNLTDDFEAYAYEKNKELLTTKEGEPLYRINMTRSIKLNVVKSHKESGKINIPTNKFKPIIPI